MRERLDDLSSDSGRRPAKRMTQTHQTDARSAQDRRRGTGWQPVLLPRAWDWRDVALWVVVAVLGLARFYHLGYGDLKDYDECLYAWRAKIICFKGWWLDQSDLAWDGYLSAAFPPLQVWVTAILFKLFGFSEFAARFWSALTGAGTVAVLFLMGRRLGRDRATGYFAALFIGSIWYFTVYSRRGQFDVPFTFFVAASLWGYVEYLDRMRIVGRRRLEADPGAWGWLALSGLALGLGLMNKIALALMASIIAGAVSAYGWLRGRHTIRRILLEQAVINGVAFLVILPWHLAMTLSPKGAEFWDWYIGHHLLKRAGTTIYLDAGPWYYFFARFWEHLPAPILALLFVAVPWSAIVLLRSLWTKAVEPAALEPTGDSVTDSATASAGPEQDSAPLVSDFLPPTSSHRRPLDHREMPYLIALLWVALPLFLFSTSGTKREPYVIPMYPPIALLAAVFVGERFHDRRRMNLLTVTLFIVAVACTLSRMKNYGRDLQKVAENLEHVLLYTDVLGRLVLLLVGFAVGTIVLRVVLRRRAPAFRFLALATIAAGATIFCLREARRVRDPEKGTRSIGWCEIRPFLDTMDYDALVFAGHYFDPGKWYYFNGLHLNWHPTIRYVPMPEYAPAQLAQFGPGDRVLVVTMWSHMMREWTDAERKDLLSKVQLLAHSQKDFAVYRLETRP